jgi:succinate-semialdehyde dehydrogenase/glutarate-semialdehyde dehydrogenase
MDQSNGTPCLNPATGEVIGHSAEDSVEHVREAIAAARVAQMAWQATPVKVRAKAILRVRDDIVDRADELSRIISQDNGKTRFDALAGEVFPAAAAASYYAKHASRFLRTVSLSAGNLALINKRSRVRKVPWGVVGVISPWNFPFSIPFSEVVMALLAGNAVVLKVASQTQMVSRALEACFLQAGLPEGLFTYVNVPGRLAGDAFLEGGINKIFFTGSVAVGKQLAAKAAETLTPLCLELGGNDPMLVCPDADLQRVAGGLVWAGFTNCGQCCAGVERVYVHRDVYPQFLDELRKRVSALRVGRDTDFHVDLGAMTTATQSDTVRRHIQDALNRGAKILVQSGFPTDGGGNFLPATVLTEVNHSMLVMREETFGPVVGVQCVADMEEAIRLANDSQYGLSASVWSRDRRAARRMAERIQAGVVMINDHLMSHGMAETPWGGFKESGIGRTHGAIGFAEMTQPQCIIDDLMPGVRKNLWWYPHGEGVYIGLRGLLDMLYARSLTRRLRGAMSALRAFPRVFKP